MPLGHEIAHLSHLELHTPVLEESVAFFVDYLGLSVNGGEGDKVFLRTFDDYEHHTVTLVPHHTSGISRTHLRAASPEALQRRVEALERSGYGIVLVRR